MKAATLVELILEFVEDIAPMVGIWDGTDTMILDANGTLAMWLQLPDSRYGSMFVGWLVAHGYDSNSLDDADVARAVQVALVGENKNVIFNWEGDTNATTKPH